MYDHLQLTLSGGVLAGLGIFLLCSFALGGDWHDEAHWKLMGAATLAVIGGGGIFIYGIVRMRKQ